MIDKIKKYEEWIAIAGGVSVGLLILLILVLIFSNKHADDGTIQSGVTYIQSLEKADISATEAKIKEIKKQERKEELENGDIDIWQQFDDSVILGDSRAVGFYYFDYMPESRTLAAGGATIRDIPDLMDQIINLNPSSIFLCYGLNDISIGYWDTVDEYLSELAQRLEEFKTALPNAVVYVNSIIPAVDPAFEMTQKWYGIPDWNVAIKAYCEENNIPYIDITSTVEAHSEMYDDDGIHIAREFYPYWAVDMITEVNEHESE